MLIYSYWKFHLTLDCNSHRFTLVSYLTDTFFLGKRKSDYQIIWFHLLCFFAKTDKNLTQVTHIDLPSKRLLISLIITQNLFRILFGFTASGMDCVGKDDTFFFLKRTSSELSQALLEPPPRKHSTKSSYWILASSCKFTYYCWFCILSTADYFSLELFVIMPLQMTAVSERRAVIPLTARGNR